MNREINGMRYSFWLLIVWLAGFTAVLTACSQNNVAMVTPTAVVEVAANTAVTPTTDPSPTLEPSPTAESSPTLEPSPTMEPSPTAEPSPTLEPSPVPTLATAGDTSPSALSIVVDHTSVALFDKIPDEYIIAASGLRMLFMDMSVGQNIHEALNCLSYPNPEAAPNFCFVTNHKGDAAFSADPALLRWDRPGGYDRSNWQYQTYQDGGGGCGYWYEKLDCYIAMITPVMDEYDVLSYQITYNDVMARSNIVATPGGYFTDNPDRSDVFDQADFEAAHPDKQFIYWTTSLARAIGTAESDAFNAQMRQYALENDQILFDVADILSHDPDGNPCYDNRDGVPYSDGNLSEDNPDDGTNYLAICPHYTTETEGGHLGSVSAGAIRVAKAFWVLMAQIAGWEP